ncbi:FAD binding domain-containing protein, partial [Paraburkholderia ginsengiterrae]|uniref:FAD binding domain-containing protein n=1 Tax=Paraburkholderia ginsengiterrae TaxID=1462993 RepID=UPI001ABF0BB0
MQYVASGIPSRAIRTSGTIGASLAHADPAAHWSLALSTLNARPELAKAGGTRQALDSAFMLGAFTTLLAAGRLIAACLLPKNGVPLGGGHHTLCRDKRRVPPAA